MVVIGAGRIGIAWKSRSEEAGRPCHLVGRTEGWEHLDAPAGDPVMVAVRNDDLEAVVRQTPEHRRDDLVFVQNGAIRELLRDLGVGRNTRGLLYFAVPARGAPVAPGGTSPFCGPHAAAVVRWFGEMELSARVVDWARFSWFELEKLLWLAIFGVLCEAHDCTVGEVVDRFGHEVDALARELLPVGRAAMGVDAPPEHLVDRLVAYSRTIPGWRASVKEWPWRNGWLVGQARRYRVETPLHVDLLRRIGKDPEAP